MDVRTKIFLIGLILLTISSTLATFNGNCSEHDFEIQGENPAEPIVDPYNSTFISSCQVLNSGLYRLNASVNSSGTCFVFNSSNTILNCDYYAINGTGIGNAIYAYGVNNISIWNCFARNYTIPFWFQDINGLDVRNIGEL